MDEWTNIFASTPQKAHRLDVIKLFYIHSNSFFSNTKKLTIDTQQSPSKKSKQIAKNQSYVNHGYMDGWSVGRYVLGT